LLGRERQSGCEQQSEQRFHLGLSEVLGGTGEI
jgi:hypothetical protein